MLVISGSALAADRWNDITDQHWIDVYMVTATEVDAVADGYLDNSFKPDTKVTREQFAKMAVDGLGSARLIHRPLDSATYPAALPTTGG